MADIQLGDGSNDGSNDGYFTEAEFPVVGVVFQLVVKVQ